MGELDALGTCAFARGCSTVCQKMRPARLEALMCEKELCRDFAW
jgi:hypothetical protein